MNSYVIAHRLAERRIGAGEMAALDGRAAALAQLVCLRAEFPLFADELERFPDLPAAALAVANKEVDSPLRTAAPELWNRAGDFIERDHPLVPLLYGSRATIAENNSHGNADHENADAPELDPPAETEA